MTQAPASNAPNHAVQAAQTMQGGLSSASPLNNGRFRVGFATDVGRKRSQNQDSFAVAPELGLFLVADGMGGHQGGETASQMAAQIIEQVVRKTEQENPGWDAGFTISQAIRSANQAIYDRSLHTPSLNGMGTTTTALLFKNGELTIGHVGDSRCYFIRPQAQGQSLSWQMTRDHSLVQEKLRAGMITRDEIATDRMKNVITRSVGFEREINVETYHFSVQRGDLFLICSDGLSGLITDSRMREIVQEHLIAPRSLRPVEDRDIDVTVRQLIRGANDNGGDDNITSVVIEVL